MRPPPAQARRGWTELEVRFATRDAQRAFVGSQVRPPGECAAPAWSLHRRASCGRPTSPAQCASSAESPVGRTPPALERLRVSPRAFRDRALESSSSLVKCSCFKIRCILCRLKAGASSRATCGSRSASWRRAGSTKGLSVLGGNDGVKRPRAGDTLELVLAPLHEHTVGSGDQIFHRG